MTTRHDLEQRLREISGPATVSARHKERLLGQLKRRAKRRRSVRALATVAVAVVAFSATLLNETPLESVNMELTTTEIGEYTANYKTHEDSDTVIMFGRTTIENGVITDVPMTTEDAEYHRRQQETIRLLHAAGETEYSGLSGFEVGGVVRIYASYFAMSDSSRLSTVETVRKDPFPEDRIDVFLAFLSDRYPHYMASIPEGIPERLPGTEIEVDGVMRPANRYRVVDDVLGEVILFSTF